MIYSEMKFDHHMAPYSHSFLFDDAFSFMTSHQG